MAIAVIKVILLLLGAAAYRAAAKAPTPPPSKEDKVIKETLFDKILGPRVIVTISEIFCIGYLIAECAVILIINLQSSRSSSHLPSTAAAAATITTTTFPTSLNSLCPAPSPSPHTLSSLSPTFLLSISTLYTGSLLRLHCFKVLGTHFTYEITIKPAHKLITSGPYAYVRHPGYTAMMLVVVGVLGTCVEPGSYLNQCWVGGGVGVGVGVGVERGGVAWWVGLLWGGSLLVSGVSVVQRAKVEDEWLGRVFKDKWDQYRRAVPYSFVPGLI